MINWNIQRFLTHRFLMLAGAFMYRIQRKTLFQWLFGARLSWWRDARCKMIRAKWRRIRIRVLPPSLHSCSNLDQLTRSDCCQLIRAEWRVSIRVLPPSLHSCSNLDQLNRSYCCQLIRAEWQVCTSVLPPPSLHSCASLDQLTESYCCSSCLEIGWYDLMSLW
jgi:hypothetical protein